MLIIQCSVEGKDRYHAIVCVTRYDKMILSDRYHDRLIGVMLSIRPADKIDNVCYLLGWVACCIGLDIFPIFHISIS